MTTGAPTKSTTKTSSQLAMQLEMTRVISNALAEDLGVSPDTVSKLAGTKTLAEFDITTNATVPSNLTATAEFVLKQPGVVCGLSIAQQVFETIDPSIKFESLAGEGQVFDAPPVTIARVQGSAQSILVAERTALNILQRLAGVATATREYSQHAQALHIQILDTRKTTPGMRLLEKYAVQCGGGTNHRIGLFDAILIKDNHVRIAGGITPAIERARAKYPNRAVEVEVTNTNELTLALASKAEKILLDNMTPDQVTDAVRLVEGRAFIEVSGGVNLSNLKSYLIEGVNAISVGALTHSVRSLDISLEIGG
jgi:nicotinate-nucleotide pyrophosphorylase (carboxylating)